MVQSPIIVAFYLRHHKPIQFRVLLIFQHLIPSSQGIVSLFFPEPVPSQDGFPQNLSQQKSIIRRYVEGNRGFEDIIKEEINEP